MQATADSLAFAPPPEPAAVRGFVLAVLAHLLLMAALTWGIAWNRDTTPIAVEAELWSTVPEQAAPKPVEAPPVVQAPPVVAPPPPPPAVNRDAEIAIEREKKREEAERLREAEEQKKIAAIRKQQEAERRQREEEKLAKQKAEQDKLKKEQLAKLQQEKLRQQNLKRLQEMAGATGSPSATGTALRSKGPSASYAGRIAARIKPNIVFTDVITTNPTAEVVIRVAPDGTIVGRKLSKSSGIASWDDAVIRAIDKTGILPRDTDGTVVPEFAISFRPKD